MNYLLDTCTFLWLATAQVRLSSSARELYEDPAVQLWLSDVSVWEIVMKHAAGKLPLPEQPRAWIPLMRSRFELNPLAVRDSAILLSGELPKVHMDPFDRLLAAQAIENGMTLVSPDTPLSDLGATRVW